MSTHISPHFTWLEAACHCGDDVPEALRPNAVHLAEDVLEPLRKRWGGPLVVISWWRARWYNQAIQGADNSQHLYALAADIAPVNRARVPELRGLVEQMLVLGELPALGGFGVYPAWLHVDARPRPNGHIARWFGRGVGSEP